jgi:DNA gyrase subunit A
MANGKHAIIVKELPYLVYRSKVIENIAELVKEKKIDGITAVNDIFGKGSNDKMRIELRRDVNPQVVLNQLYKHTQLQDTFGVNNLVIVDGEPKTLNLKQILQEYLRHQEDVVTRRTKFDLKKAEDRAELVEGFLKAIDNIDEVIRIIRESDDTEAAKTNLMAAFSFTENQAQAIVDMRLRSLTGLERKKLEDEYADLKQKIAYYKSILEDENKLLEVIRTEILDIAAKYGDDRRTRIVHDDSELADEDLIEDEEVVIAMTDKGYIKRMDPDNFKAQNRGGKGIKGMSTIDDDFIVDLITTTTHHSINFFTNKGRIYRLKTYQIPEASRTGRGVAIVNLLQLQQGEKISAIIPLEEYQDDGYLLMATRSGRVKKTPIDMMRNVRRNGLNAINLKDGDELVDVKSTDGSMDAILITKKGMAMVFNEKDVRAQGRAASGVRGIRLRSGDEVIGLQLCLQGEYLLTVSELGIGKRTPMSEFKVQRRGGLGLRCHRLSAEKTGDLVSAKLTDEDREILMITNEGIIIRLNVKNISVYGRGAYGVKLMNIDAASGVRVAKVTKMSKSDPDEEDDGDLSDGGSEDAAEVFYEEIEPDQNDDADEDLDEEMDENIEDEILADDEDEEDE